VTPDELDLFEATLTETERAWCEGLYAWDARLRAVAELRRFRRVEAEYLKARAGWEALLNAGPS